ncbi:MAG: hypothetical protein AAF628_38065 [Planctomycetota bacterium]
MLDDLGLDRLRPRRPLDAFAFVAIVVDREDEAMAGKTLEQRKPAG